MWWSNPGWKRRGDACKSTLLEAGHSTMTPIAIISCTVQNREHVLKTTRQGDWSQFNFVRTTDRPKKKSCIFSQECIFHIHDYSRKSWQQNLFFLEWNDFWEAMACECLKLAHLWFSQRNNFSLQFRKKNNGGSPNGAIVFLQIGFTNEAKIIFQKNEVLGSSFHYIKKISQVLIFTPA